MTVIRQTSQSGWLIIMAKVPGAGRVKTRLAREVSSATAAYFYRHTCRAVVARLAASTRWRTALCITPDVGIGDRFWPPDIPKIRQGDGDIGRRMQRAIAAMPPGPVVLVGTDIPAIRRSHIARAFKVLGDSDIVFGPAQDGGFWLVGSSRRRPMPLAFDNVRWSSPFALQDTLDNLKNYAVTQIDQLNDVDTRHDLLSVSSWYGRRILPTDKPNGHTLNN